MVNLAGREECADRVRDMMAMVWRNAKTSGDHTISNSHYYGMRFAAVGPNAG
jgi:hypothetical protein